MILFGGVAGVVLKYLFDQRKERVQTIRQRVSLFPLDPTQMHKAARVTLTVSSTSKD